MHGANNAGSLQCFLLSHRFPHAFSISGNAPGSDGHSRGRTEEECGQTSEEAETAEMPEEATAVREEIEETKQFAEVSEELIDSCNQKTINVSGRLEKIGKSRCSDSTGWWNAIVLRHTES